MSKRWANKKYKIRGEVRDKENGEDRKVFFSYALFPAFLIAPLRTHLSTEYQLD